MSKKLQTVAISILFLSLFFINGPGDDDVSRSFDASWDLGHIIVFALWSYLLVKWVKPLAGSTFLKQAALVLAFSLVVGASIELIQYKLPPRTASVSDVLRDVVGALVAIAFLARERKDASNKLVKTFQATATLLVVVSLFPLAAAVTDEYAARKNFPVLSDFESPLEISRWECSTGCSIVRGVAPDGGGVLKVPLKTTLYSGVSLDYFPHDWRGYRFLSFKIFNESGEPLALTCKIDDKEHRLRGYEYKDRYNGRLALNPGWNSITIPLADVASAPRNRRMDMVEIRGLALFATRLKKEMNIYIDDVVLIK